MEEKKGSIKRGRKAGGKFNAVDLFIILVVIGIIGVFLISLFASDGDSDAVKLEYTVQFENVDAVLADNVKIGEKVYESSSRTPVGVVTAVDNSSRYTVYEYDSEKNAVVAIEYPDRYNLKVSVSADAVFSEGVGYSVRGIRIAVGAGLALRFADYVGNAYCIEISEAE